ncbi:MAG: preprotein translocase subunit YajC [Actinomycetota bacterium]|nr:preprotein translocase subunit YajC [Actinomycetota bacterium]
MKSIGTLLPFVLIIGGFYLLALRPARKRQQASAQMQSELRPGMQVMTGSGLFGTVSSVEDDAVVLEVSPGVSVRWARQAIARVVPTGVPGEDEPTAEPVEPLASADDESRRVE